MANTESVWLKERHWTKIRRVVRSALARPDNFTKDLVDEMQNESRQNYKRELLLIPPGRVNKITRKK